VAFNFENNKVRELVVLDGRDRLLVAMRPHPRLRADV
jgi:hypothetical protein